MTCAICCVWQEHEPFLTGYEPHSFVRCQNFKYIETLPARRYKLDGNAQPFVFAYELQGCLSELSLEERLIEHWLTYRNTLHTPCTLPLEDALQLVHLYAERGSPKYEPAAMRWLSRYLEEGTPRLQFFAEIAADLARRKL